MSTTPREIGTLIVVVLKANHLPNKRHIGKQDPYCSVTHNGEKRRTKAIKRGGQHPEWDEELRFTLYEDESSPNLNEDGPSQLPPKDRRGPKKVKGGWTMKIACFADDPREPDLIGEADVDLTEVLTKGETDEWFTLMNKDKFSGKVYLELTFWSNEPAPEKKVTPKPAKSKQYGGPGSFVPSEETTSKPPNGTSNPSRIVSTGSIYEHPKQGSDNIPLSLRASNSLAKLDLYVPPYERSVDSVANEFRDLGVSDPRRRESFPPARPTSSTGFSTISSNRSHVYDPSISESSEYGLDYSPGQSHPTATSGSQYQATYHPQYESQSQYIPPTRGPRHSVPASSSGFIPLSNSTAYPLLPTHSSEPSLFAGHPTPSFTPQSTYTSHTPAPETYHVPSSSGSFVPQQSFPQSQSFQYNQYPSSTPIAQAYSPSVLNPIPLQVGATHSYQPFTPSSSHDTIPNPPGTNALSTGFGSMTPSSSNPRPLPAQPQVMYAQPPMPVLYSAPPAVNAQPPITSFASSQPTANTYLTNDSYSQPLPPPPPPPVQYTVGQSQSDPPSILIPPPPPPPLKSTSPSRTTRRQSSLPQPPVVYQQTPHPAYQPPPPPPLPPTDFLNHSLPPPPPPPPSLLSDLSSAQSTSYHVLPLPNPPSIGESQGQWITPTNYTQSGY
ncbi:hypothetical protein H0H93_008326 [Arthromyces matolae]|nr:hypothetical protein H0H93_008326 [Arthromyces matolae]